MNNYINDINLINCCKSIEQLRFCLIENNIKWLPQCLECYYDCWINDYSTFYSLYYKSLYFNDVLTAFRCEDSKILFHNLFLVYDFGLIKFSIAFLHARYTKKSRIYKRIEFMLNNFKICYFCTFTFNKKYIDLSIKYKRDVLCSLLKKLNTCYIGNVDYGEKRGRMHFHVIIAENDIHICKKNILWDFGWYDIKVISNKDSIRLGSYIMKLVNHATKQTTKDSIITPRGIYSFNKLMKDGVFNE